MPPLVLVSVAWMAGLIAAHHWIVPTGVRPESVAVLCLIPVLGILIWAKDRRMLLGAICAAALLAGVLRYQASVPDLDDPGLIAHYNDLGWVTLDGTIHRYPDVRDTWTNLVLSVERITFEDIEYPVTGLVLINAPRYPEHRYGDRVRVSGKLETPPEWEAFSYRRYLAHKGIYSYIHWPRITGLAAGEGNPFWATLYGFRDRARALISRIMPEPEASVLQGILLGIESEIPKALMADYNATGTSHIIVISGANITIVAALASNTLGRLLGKRKAFWLSTAGIVIYVLLVGADAVVVRAGTMGCLYLLARYLGRSATAYVSLLASALLLTLINPLALWDIGFQLSIAATLGLSLFSTPLEGLFERMLSPLVSAAVAHKIVRSLSDLVVVTTAAQILTTPLVVYHFGRLSLVSPLSNLLILLVQPVIMILGGAATLIGLIPFLEPLARVVSWVPWAFLAYTNAVVRWMASWPMAATKIAPAGPLGLVLTYLTVAAASWLAARRRSFLPSSSQSTPRGRKVSTVLAGALAVSALLIWLAVFQLPDGRLHVAFLDVGQGDAILITTPRGRQILVDGGPDPSVLLSALGREMPFWDRTLDLVVLTHPDADHIMGLTEVLRRFQVGMWWDNGSASNSAAYEQCLALLSRQGTQRQGVVAGSGLDLGNGLILEVIHPSGDRDRPADDDNNASVVIRLVWEGASFLLTGDIEAQAERLLVEGGLTLQAQVLKVAHHGSGGSTTAAFLDSVSPRYAVLSVGEGNRAGHPHPEVLERLSLRSRTTILRTDQDGTVEFITNGELLSVRTHR